MTFLRESRSIHLWSLKLNGPVPPPALRPAMERWVAELPRAWPYPGALHGVECEDTPKNEPLLTLYPKNVAANIPLPVLRKIRKEIEGE